MQKYHCFSCGADDEVFDFKGAFYNLDFKRACTWLVQRYGISQGVTPAARLEAKLLAIKGITYREASIILTFVDALLQDSIIASPLKPKHQLHIPR